MVAADEADAARIGEAAAQALVGDELDRAEQPDGANFADERVILEFREQLRKRRSAELRDAERASPAR